MGIGQIIAVVVLVAAVITGMMGLVPQLEAGMIAALAAARLT